jgi:hypothetical protein
MGQIKVTPRDNVSICSIVPKEYLESLAILQYDLSHPIEFAKFLSFMQRCGLLV